MPIPSLICPLTQIYPIVFPLKHPNGAVRAAGKQCSTLSKDLGQHVNTNSECAVSCAWIWFVIAIRQPCENSIAVHSFHIENAEMFHKQDHFYIDDLASGDCSLSLDGWEWSYVINDAIMRTNQLNTLYSLISFRLLVFCNHSSQLHWAYKILYL